jgi:general secretion pathway protein K
MNLRSRKKDERGIALIIVILALTVVTAFVVEFAYAVYVDMNLLNNWREGRRLAALASSGASLAASVISQYSGRLNTTLPNPLVLPDQDVFDDKTLLSVTIEDENAKFDLNKLVDANGLVQNRYQGFRRMLEQLKLNPDIASRVVDWIDKDSIPMLTGSENGARNDYMTSVDELMLIPGINRDIYKKLKPYVTVFGTGSININTADPLVIMTLSDQIDMDMAQSVVTYRQSTPFNAANDITKVAGFGDDMWKQISGIITVKPTMFSISTTATSEDGLARTVDCVIDGSGLVKYWKEY